MSDEPAPEQVAAFDQIHAQIAESLDALIQGYRQEVAQANRDITVAGLAEYLLRNMAPAAMAEHLAIAVDRLERL
jgi:hypothetical protein